MTSDNLPKMLFTRLIESLTVGGLFYMMVRNIR